MFDEMYFLFDIDQSIANGTNGEGKVRNAANPAESARTSPVLKDDGKFYNQTYVVTAGDAKNFIKSNVNAPYQASKKNPYLQILDHFDGVNSKKSLKLKSSDLAYLRDIGVNPINRLMILRRFPIGTVVPRDLNELDIEPISTIVGWVKNDSDFLNFSFNEVWKQQGSSEMLHVLLNDMISKEFGINMNEIMPIPGWGVGLVFGFLNRMGLTDYNKYNVPLGDPNVLKESITRPHEEYGLESDFSFELETVYEQKYIGDIDLTVSLMDILQNCITMGTSDVKFIGKASSKLIQQLTAANNDPTNSQGWITLINMVIDGFIGAIKGAIKDAIDTISKMTEKEVDGTKGGDGKDKTEEGDKKQSSKQKKADKAGAFSAAFDMIVKSILASTVAKYHWPLKGSIAMLTGQAATPWHLSIGNPYSPLLSMTNVHVSKVGVTMKGDMMYNDMPKYFEVKVSMKQGRNMGGNEIYDMFGIEYQRVYRAATNKK